MDEVNLKKETQQEGKLSIKLLQVIGIMTVISGLFGAGFQKGMIVTMNLGNLSGSYEIREVFNSAFLGLLHGLQKLNMEKYWPTFFDALKDNLYLTVSIFAVIGILIAATYRGKKNIKKRIVSAFYYIDSPKTLGRKALKSFFWAPIAVIAGGYSLILLYSTIIFLIPIALSLLVFPTLLGYVAGENYINEAMKREFCVPITDDSLNTDKLRQCTQINIKGKAITGQIFLENSDSYFIRRNSSFLYVTKNGENCISSIFADPEDIKNSKDFEFKDIDEDIEKLCSYEVGINWKDIKPNSL